MYVYVCVLSHFSCVQLFATLWTTVHQAPLSICGILWVGILDCIAILFSRDLPNLGIESASLMPPALPGRFFTTSTSWEAHTHIQI